MDKNRYFYEFQSALDRACEDKKVKKHRVELVDYFQQHWEVGLSRNVSGVDLLKEAMSIICVGKPKGRRKK